MKFTGISAFLLDLDGTLYLGNQIFPFTVDFLAKLNEKGLPYYMLTNNSSRSKQEYMDKLNKMGIFVPPERIMTSAMIAADLIASQYPGKTFFVLGTRALRQELENAGVATSDTGGDAVLLGFDTELTFEKLRIAANLIAQGAVYIATHPDVNCPADVGFYPDAGAMAELLFASAGRRPEKVAGKPSEYAVAYLQKKIACPPGEICMVGDRLDTDIAFGRHGLKTALVLTGITKEKDIPKAPYPPTWVFPSVKELAKEL